MRTASTFTEPLPGRIRIEHLYDDADLLGLPSLPVADHNPEPASEPEPDHNPEPAAPFIITPALADSGFTPVAPVAHSSIYNFPDSLPSADFAPGAELENVNNIADDINAHLDAYGTIDAGNATFVLRTLRGFAQLYGIEYPALVARLAAVVPELAATFPELAAAALRFTPASGVNK